MKQVCTRKNGSTGRDGPVIAGKVNMLRLGETETK